MVLLPQRDRSHPTIPLKFHLFREFPIILTIKHLFFLQNLHPLILSPVVFYLIYFQVIIPFIFVSSNLLDVVIFILWTYNHRCFLHMLIVIDLLFCKYCISLPLLGLLPSVTMPQAQSAYNPVDADLGISFSFLSNPIHIW